MGAAWSRRAILTECDAVGRCLVPKTKNSALNAAKKAKDDEFYTTLNDIEEECRHYREHFRGKTILCNCDDPRVSNFWRYFTENFEFLGLKKVIATCYKNQEVDLFTQQTSERAIYQIYEGDTNGDMKVSDDEIAVHELEGDGDFRSPECLKLLDEADIVVTNPPFSLFREFVELLIRKEKQFLIIGNMTALTARDIFPLFRDGKVWLGASIHSGDREFQVPQDYPLDAAGFRIGENGEKYIRVKGVRWFTNLDYKERHETLPLYNHYNCTDYQKFDNYDAICVNATSDIPCDYDGIMGVPISFMDKFNPEQFDIIGLAAGNIRGLAGIPTTTGKDGPYINGKLKFGRILIRRRHSDHIL